MVDPLELLSAPVVPICFVPEPDAPAPVAIEISQMRVSHACVGMLNRTVNVAISSVSDRAQRDVPEHWIHPVEELRFNSGDCE
jgi:hypothetical protein